MSIAVLIDAKDLLPFAVELSAQEVPSGANGNGKYIWNDKEKFKKKFPNIPFREDINMLS